MNVAVPFASGNTIPELFGNEEATNLMRLEIDSEDGTIYTRSTIRGQQNNLVNDLIENKVEVLVYNKMLPELEEAIQAAGIKLVPGRTGNTIQAAVDEACK